MLTVPLVVSLISTSRASVGFQVTPKHRRVRRLVLVGGLPLIVLSLFNLANLLGLVQQLMLGLGRLGTSVELVWAG